MRRRRGQVDALAERILDMLVQLIGPISPKRYVSIVEVAYSLY
jgi:hypothetical protein